MTLNNHFIEIRTGEGKSIMLGAAATVLALKGFEVDVVSYSSYLSERDYSSFKKIFDFFKVSDKIRYY